MKFEANENLSGSGWEAVADELVYLKSHGRFRDGVTLAVIFEGGALRGVVSCGYGLALSEFANHLNFRNLWGASSGGLNAVYFASGDSKLALSIYAENATDKRCTNPWRFPNVINPDWLVDEWIFLHRRFNEELIRSNKANVIIVLTDLRDATPRYMNLLDLNEDTLRKTMKATASAPMLTNAYQIIDGVPYGDGAVSDAIPYYRAISAGATHVLCFLTRPKSYRKQYNLLNKTFERLRLLKHKNAFVDAYFRRASVYNNLLDTLYTLDNSHRLPPTLIVHPRADSETPSNIETNPGTIARFGKIAYSNAKNLFDAFSLT